MQEKRPAEKVLEAAARPKELAEPSALPGSSINPSFAHEFALMKKLLSSFQTKMQAQDEKILDLSNQMTKLAHVNLKLNADNKVLKD